MVPLLRVTAIVLVQSTAPLISPQDAAAQPALHRPDIVRFHLGDGVEAYPALCMGLEYAVDDADMEVSMQVERGAEAMDERQR